ncbi:replication initiation protein [Aeromonas hydrophila]
MVKPALQAAVFVDRIPRRPYCSDDPAQGLLIRPQATALAYRHIQHNPPPHVSCLVFDVDRKPHEQHWREGYHEWRERGLPAPHWISINPENGNYHLGYLLASPVARTSAAKLKPLRYLGVTSENGKNRTVSRWHGLASRKRSFLRGFNENQIRASAGMACCFLENHSHIARLKQPSFENHENAVSRGWQLAQSRAVAGYRIS